LPEIIASSKTDFDFRTNQGETKVYAKNLFAEAYKDIDRLTEVFDNTKISSRNFCVPVGFFEKDTSFENKNNIFIENALKYSVIAINECLEKSKINKEEITDIIYICSTGLATPSLDALIINEMKLNPYINRLPIWGLGCAGGVSGIAKAEKIALSNPDAKIIVLAVELCSLTFRRNDLSKSNFIATSLFSDGIACVLITGDNYENKTHKIKILSSQSRLYYDSLDVMGWEFLDTGFKVVFSRDIPSIVNDNVKKDVEIFLEKNNLKISDIKNFIFHPGGAKVINAYIKALNLKDEDFKYSSDILTRYGNMSSVTAFYVLDEFICKGYKKGYGLMLSLGPGFSSEMVLLSME
jgi:alkylresorcinol/alkylpyrone synthase